jgi:2'-5' RNA ligase
MRLFYALLLPPSAREAIRPSWEIVRQCGFSMPKLEQLHFTLQFLGEQPSPASFLSRPDFEPFRLTIGRGFAFKHVIALDVLEGRERLVALAPEPFHPHLTLGRKKPGADKQRALSLLPSGPIASFEVRQYHLMQSELGKGGARHTIVASFPVNAGGSSG